jgi:hypothetical protein
VRRATRVRAPIGIPHPRRRVPSPRRPPSRPRGVCRPTRLPA